MRIALSTSVMQRGRSGVGQYVLSLVRGLLSEAERHEFTLFVLEMDLPLFKFAAGSMLIEPVSERFRKPVRNILWHQAVLPGLVRRRRIEVLHVPSYRRMLWTRPCALVSTIHDLAAYHVGGKYDPLRMFYGRTVARALAPSSPKLSAAMARWLPSDPESFVLELGPGTGAVTEALIKRGLREDRLVAIEKNPKMARLLRERFPRAHIITGDAWQMDRPAARRRKPVESVGAVISSLPLLNFPRKGRDLAKKSAPSSNQTANGCSTAIKSATSSRRARPASDCAPRKSSGLIFRPPASAFFKSDAKNHFCFWNCFNCVTNPRTCSPS